MVTYEIVDVFFMLIMALVCVYLIVRVSNLEDQIEGLKIVYKGYRAEQELRMITEAKLQEHIERQYLRGTTRSISRPQNIDPSTNKSVWL